MEPFDLGYLGEIATWLYELFVLIRREPVMTLFLVEAFFWFGLGGLIGWSTDYIRLFTKVFIPMVGVCLLSSFVINLFLGVEGETLVAFSIAVGLAFAYAIRPWIWL